MSLRTQTGIATQITTLIESDTDFAVSPADLRSVLTDMRDSMLAHDLSNASESLTDAQKDTVCEDISALRTTVSSGDRVELGHSEDIATGLGVLTGATNTIYHQIPLSQDLSTFDSRSKLEIVLNASPFTGGAATAINDWTELEIVLEDFLRLPVIPTTQTTLPNTFIFGVSRIFGTSATAFTERARSNVFVGRSSNTRILIQTRHYISTEIYVFVTPP